MDTVHNVLQNNHSPFLLLLVPVRDRPSFINPVVVQVRSNTNKFCVYFLLNSVICTQKKVYD